MMSTGVSVGCAACARKGGPGKSAGAEATELRWNEANDVEFEERLVFGRVLIDLKGRNRDGEESLSDVLCCVSVEASASSSASTFHAAAGALGANGGFNAAVRRDLSGGCQR
eukprot:CAMPEP_0170634682 /NCGR_PEP_ID=MMETSP0224-20130122/36751_1 /TAXON_ID=285029 /ORGANISM="Togula jolla, Strain CCCM 725" /LENGTH=111 /DNA_ID=CAMNT_0010963997 /DNA_START=142 /DNA_END=474 /DNA_ORIENTATION=+